MRDMVAIYISIPRTGWILPFRWKSSSPEIAQKQDIAMYIAFFPGQRNFNTGHCPDLLYGSSLIFFKMRSY